MNKPTDDEAVARRVLANKLAMLLREQVPFIEAESERTRPDLEMIRSACMAIYEGMDAELSKYDRKHGTQREKAATKIWLRTLLGRQQGHSDLLESDVRNQQALNDRSTAQLVEAVAYVEACQRLVADMAHLCQSHGIAVPPELMGPPQ